VPLKPTVGSWIKTPKVAPSQLVPVVINKNNMCRNHFCITHSVHHCIVLLALTPSCTSLQLAPQTHSPLHNLLLRDKATAIITVQPELSATNIPQRKSTKKITPWRYVHTCKNKVYKEKMRMQYCLKGGRRVVMSHVHV